MFILYFLFIIIFYFKSITQNRITTNMAKEFCPTCGYKTLQRVIVTVDANGNKIYKGRNRPMSKKGLRVFLNFLKFLFKLAFKFMLNLSFHCQRQREANIQTIQY